MRRRFLAICICIIMMFGTVFVFDEEVKAEEVSLKELEASSERLKIDVNLKKNLSAKTAYPFSIKLTNKSNKYSISDIDVSMMCSDDNGLEHEAIEYEASSDPVKGLEKKGKKWFVKKLKPKSSITISGTIKFLRAARKEDNYGANLECNASGYTKDEDSGRIEENYWYGGCYLTIKNGSQAKKGQKLSDSKSKAAYVVTKAGSDVAYAGTKDKKAASVTIPATVQIGGTSYKVTSIASNAFKNNKKLKKVVISNSVKKIDKNAFYGCKNLKTITVKSKSITKVGGNAFKGISKKAQIKVPKAKLKAYKKLFKKSGLAKSVKIKK